jgi:hypothetical protein
MAYAKLSGIPQPELFWQDPETPEAQQAAQQQAQAAHAMALDAKQANEENIQAAMAIEKFKGENKVLLQHMTGEQQREIEQLKSEVEYFKTLLDAKATNKDLNIQEAQLVLSQANAVADRNSKKLETANEASTSAA